MSKPDSIDVIHSALALNYETTALVDYYNNWVRNYDRDVQDAGYSGPVYIVSYLGSVLERHGVAVDSALDVEILDAGCGTGMVGKALHEQGYRRIDGFDLCKAMTEKAREADVYRSLDGGYDMTKTLPYRDNAYDITICCGVFTQGHVPPQALHELVRITRKGGLVLVSTRKSYYESTEFESVSRQMQETGLVTLIDRVMNGPYVTEEGAHYWSFHIA